MTNTGSNHSSDTAAIVEQMRRRSRELVTTHRETIDQAFIERLEKVEALLAQLGKSQEYVTPNALLEIIERLKNLENAPRDITPSTDTSELEQLIKQLTERISRLESEPNDGSGLNRNSSFNEEDIIALAQSVHDTATSLVGFISNLDLLEKRVDAQDARLSSMPRAMLEGYVRNLRDIEALGALKKG